jgi:hypothetical protein
MNREVFAEHMAGITAHPDDADAFQAAVVEVLESGDYRTAPTGPKFRTWLFSYVRPREG